MNVENAKETLTNLGEATKTLLDLVTEKENLYGKEGSISEEDVMEVLKAMGHCQEEAQKLK